MRGAREVFVVPKPRESATWRRGLPGPLKSWRAGLAAAPRGRRGATAEPAVGVDRTY